MPKRAVLLLGLLTTIVSSQATPDTARQTRDRQFNEALDALRVKHGLPALIAARMDGGRLVTIAAVGQRAFKTESPVTTDDLWHLGSCGKAMTATLIARLVEKGKLSFETPLAETFPKLKETLHKDFRGVTVKQLLGHRSGLERDVPDPLWRDFVTTNDPPRVARARLVAGLLSRPPATKPGTEFCYSNSGYVVAAAIVERLMDRPFEDLIREEVFVPLGMTGAGFGAPGKKGILDQPRGHTTTLGVKTALEPGRRADNPPGHAPAGTIHMTVADWSRFVAAHLGHAPKDYLKPETFELLHTPLAGQDYALGWGTTIRPWAGGPVLTHSGSNTYWFSVVWAAPKKDLAVFAITNEFGPAAQKACDEAVGLLLVDPRFRER